MSQAANFRSSSALQHSKRSQQAAAAARGSRALHPGPMPLLCGLPASSRQGFLGCRALRGGEGPLDDADAYAEAHQTYVQASRLAQLQTRHEMETAFASEEPPRAGGSVDVPAESAVLALLQENGLSAREAALLYKDLYKHSTGSSNSMASPAPPPPPQQQQHQREGATASGAPPTPSSPFQQQQQRPPQQQQRQAPTGNPLGVIPLATTGLPPRARQPRGRPTGSGSGSPPSYPPAPAAPPPSYSAGGCGDIPAAFLSGGGTGGSRAASSQGLSRGGNRGGSGGQTQAPDWDQWGASSDVPDDGSGNGIPTSGFESSVGAYARQGRPPASSAPSPAPTSRGGGSSSYSGGGEDWPLAHVSNMDGGGCGSIPDWARQGTNLRPGEPLPPSPFQGMCAETVTPIPYNPAGDSYGFQPSGGQQQRTPSSGGGSRGGGSYPTASAAPGQSLGGCGSVPSGFDNSDYSRGGGSYPTASAAAGQSLGGCGSVPSDFSMWDKDEMFQEQPPQQQQRRQQAPPPSPFQGMCAETVTPIPYDASADPFTRGGFAPPPSNPMANSGRAAPPPPQSRAPPPSPPPPQQQQGSWAVQGPALGATSPLSSPGGQQPAQQQQLTLAQLSARLDRWRRVLPGVNPARLAAVDAHFLHADVTMGLRAMITLVAELPGRDVMGMLDRVPKLLWADDLSARLHTCVDTLARLHPSRDTELAKDIVAEHPELIFRMHYYTKVTLIDELPIEIQNIILSVLADQGIGSTFRYYKNRKTDYGAELTRGSSNEPMM